MVSAFDNFSSQFFSIFSKVFQLIDHFKNFHQDAPQNYLDFTDGQDNYLQPEKAGNGPPSEYLLASAGDDNLKDDVDRPLLAKG